MPIGKVKFFDVMKGYGFIESAEGEKDIFVHFKDLQAAGLTSLSENQEVEYKGKILSSGAGGYLLG